MGLGRGAIDGFGIGENVNCFFFAFLFSFVYSRNFDSILKREPLNGTG